MIITYGVRSNTIDVTAICNSQLKYQDVIIIPKGDHSRSRYFTDPVHGSLKSIFIKRGGHITQYDDSASIYIDCKTNNVWTKDVPEHIKQADIQEKINSIHNELHLKYGSFDEELPEQRMAVRYLTGAETVLEIGGNVGRNSLVIAHILRTKNNNRLVVLESDPDIARQLRENRDANKFDFAIEESALSNRPLIQAGWQTIVSDVVLSGYKPVKTINYSDLLQKYQFQFDTLVLDCEGAFYYILKDMPEVLTHITTIIMENDYTDITHKQYIDDVLRTSGFHVEYCEAGGWGPCFNQFFQVWKRT